jgi:hypothetical protein
VTNRDGLVNHTAYRASREGRLLPGLEGHVVMDAPRTMRASLGPGEWERLVEAYPPVPGTLSFGPRREPIAPSTTGPAGWRP